MSRPITIFTGQWADVPFEKLCQMMKSFGYDGLEIACWGDHLDVFKAASDQSYCDEKRRVLEKYGLNVWAISNHLAGQLISDPNFDGRSDIFAPTEYAGDAEAKRQWAIDSMKSAAHAAKNLGVKVVNGFTGSPIWHMLYSFPPVSDEMIEDGYRRFAELFNPVLDEFAKCGVKFALEVHPTEIAFDIHTARRTLEAIERRPEFGFNFDPSHLLWQMINPVKFIEAFPSRIYHCHIKDAALQLDGVNSILASHLNFGQAQRGWDFRSPGHGQVNFEEIIRALNRVGYNGPLSIEWEDCGMEREYGAKDACAFARKLDFNPSNLQFDAAFDN